MSKNNVVLGLLCGWVSVITLLTLYFLFTGYLTVAKNEAVRADEMGGPWQEAARLQKLKRGVHSADEQLIEGDGGVNKNLESYGRSDVKASSRSVLSKAVEEAVFNDEHSTNSRAAFELVVVLSALLPKITNISRIATPSPEAFRNYVAPVGLPVIFTDMLEGRKLGEWTWDYIKSKWGDTVFHNTRQGKYSIKTNKYGKHFVNRVSVRLADFVDVVTGKRSPSKEEEKMYITKQRVIPKEALEAEFYYPPFYPGSNTNCYLEPTGWWVGMNSGLI